MERKGFPESYDRRALLRFVSKVKAGRPEVRVPVYDHLTYDILPGREIVVNRPDVLIVEGLNVLQPARPTAEGTSNLAVSDFFDFSIYVDALGRAIRPVWPTDRCGLPQEAVSVALDELEETDNEQYPVRLVIPVEPTAQR